MALKPMQRVIVDDINMKCQDVAAQGTVVCFSSTVGNVTTVASAVSGKKIAGVLLQDVVARGYAEHMVVLGQDTGTVNEPLLRKSRNETHVSGVCRLLKVGQVDTNWIDFTDNFIPGDIVYLTSSGKMSHHQDNAGCEKIGHVISGKDSDLYIRVFVNLA